jgi:O-antigen/teichoic acid export membrane protein
MQLLGLGLIPFFISTLFQYIFAALDAQKAFFGSTLIGSVLRIILLVTLIPKYNFVGPAVAFVVAEMVTVGIWIYQLQKMGYPAHIINILWRPIVAGIVMGLVLVWFLNSPLVWQLIGAVLSLLSYIAVLFAVRTFSKEEIHQAREGIAFVSPFVEAWAKKIKRNT